MNTIEGEMVLKLASRTDAKNPRYLKILETILWDHYCIRRQITFDDLAVEFSNASSLNWITCKSPLFSALNELNKLSEEYIFSACAVASDGMPASGFFS